jgi:hypothetical protein
MHYISRRARYDAAVRADFAAEDRVDRVPVARRAVVALRGADVERADVERVDVERADVAFRVVVRARAEVARRGAAPSAGGAPAAAVVRVVVRRRARASSRSRWPTTSGVPSGIPATSAPHRMHAASLWPVGCTSKPPHSGHGSATGRSQTA